MMKPKEKFEIRLKTNATNLLMEIDETPYLVRRNFLPFSSPSNMIF